MAAKHTLNLAVILLAGVSLAACVTPRYAARPGATAQAPSKPGGYKVGKPYQVGGVWYVPREQPNYDEIGVGSWYGDAFHMKTTANGELFDMNLPSAAHTTLPLPSIVEVTNLENGRKIQVRVNDRGPFVGDRIIDLSREAARQLGYERQGVARVRVRYVGPAPLLGRDAGVRFASASPVEPPPKIVQPAPDATFEIAAALPPPPQTVTAQALAPAAQAPIVTVASGLRIQAAAFANEANAKRAVGLLSPAGQAVIEPLERDGLILYRVMLTAPADEAEAFALRDRVAEIGFADARVVRAF
ncbi:septal ring lytic transglycosylase RlpA family protein [Phenylobacterium sp.]|uniref:septal ring lytic transglycosylase RlpA family protein n=1 Tax=Phenylobacterium sp. TaxID=1871053 RepID=UPI00391AA4B1